MELFDRYWEVLVGVGGDRSVRFTGLDIDFTVKKTLRPEPNTLSITIYGLDQETRDQISELAAGPSPKTVKQNNKSKKKNPGVSSAPAVGTQVELIAGYIEGYEDIFVGDCYTSVITHEDGEVALKLEGEDGGRAYIEGRVNATFGPGTSRLTVVKECIKAMGLGDGNLLQFGPQLLQSYSHGTTVSGLASNILKKIFRTSGLTYSIQNNTLALRSTRDDTLVTVGLVVGPNSGLLGHPQRNDSGGITIRTLMIPGMVPGVFFNLDYPAPLGGVYQIITSSTSGDSAGDQWGHTLECIRG